VGEIGVGLVVLVGAVHGDTAADAVACATKISGLRVFRDDHGKMNRSVADVGGSVLVVSQFTLAGDVRKGRRPSFVAAADPATAEPLIATFCEVVRAQEIRVEQGVFGADMTVTIVNDGPVTLIVDAQDGVVL